MKFEVMVADGSEGKFDPYVVEGENVAEAAGKAVAAHLAKSEYGNPAMSGAGDIKITIRVTRK